MTIYLLGVFITKKRYVLFLRMSLTGALTGAGKAEIRA